MMGTDNMVILHKSKQPIVCWLLFYYLLTLLYQFMQLHTKDSAIDGLKVFARDTHCYKYDNTAPE